MLILDLFGFFLSSLGFKGLHVASRILGFIAFDLLRIRRKVILENLNIAFGSELNIEQRIKLGRESTSNFILTTLEFMGSKGLYPKAKVRITGHKIALDALARQNGILFLGTHTSNFELMCALGTKHVAPAHGVTKAVGSGAFEAWVRKRRSENGEFEIKRDAQHRGQTEILAVLDKNETIGFMVDQRRKKGIVAPFFGRPALTNSGLFYFKLLRPGVAIVPVLIYRHAPGDFEFIFWDEILAERNGNESDTEFIERHTIAMNILVEKIVRSRPQEYFWMHKRWKM